MLYWLFLVIVPNVCLSLNQASSERRNSTVQRRFGIEECTSPQKAALDHMISILKLKLGWTMTSALNHYQHEVNYQMFERAYGTLDPNMRRLVADRLSIVLSEISAPNRGHVKFVCDNSGYLCSISASESEGPYTRLMDSHPPPFSDPTSHDQRRSWIALVCQCQRSQEIRLGKLADS